ncbi:MAG: Zn-ribbon domain-containing OB-fold protein [Promethearchaeota archaeon]
MSNKENLVNKKCKKCGYLQDISHLRCIKCKNNTFDKIEANGICVLLTYTLLKAPPMEFIDKGPYALGVVQFKNGIKALGQISPKENLRIGMKLKPVYEKICDNLDGNEIYGYVFKLIE